MFNVYDQSQAGQLYKEISILTKSQDCEALISFKGAFHHEGNIGMVIEYMDRGSLEFLLKPSVQLYEGVLAAIIYQILWGLAYLHYDNRLVINRLVHFTFCSQLLLNLAQRYQACKCVDKFFWSSQAVRFRNCEGARLVTLS